MKWVDFTDFDPALDDGTDGMGVILKTFQ